MRLVCLRDGSSFVSCHQEDGIESPTLGLKLKKSIPYCLTISPSRAAGAPGSQYQRQTTDRKPSPARLLIKVSSEKLPVKGILGRKVRRVSDWIFLDELSVSRKGNQTLQRKLGVNDHAPS